MKKDSWLYSDSFLKRAIAIWGYNAVGNFIISLPLVILIMLITALIAPATVNVQP